MIAPIGATPSDGIQVRESRRQFFRLGLAIASGILLRPSAPVQCGSLPMTPRVSPCPGVERCTANAAGTREAGALGERIGTEAEHIVHTLHHTHYQHNELVDPATGTYDVDCSGFVGYVLKRIAPQQFGAIPKENGWAIPRAFKYEEFFRSISGHAENGWRAVSELSQVRRGDIVAWAIPLNLGKDEDTGHVFVVAAAPAKLEEGLLAVRVCDSSTVPHYDDSRGQGGAFHTGVGTGTIHLKIDASGKPLSFQFGPGDKFHAVPIAMGRAT